MIRAAVITDAASIADLCAQLGYKSSKEDIEQRLKKVMDDNRDVVFVAEADGKVIGWLQVVIKSTIESGSFAEIVGLVVDRDYRGKGMGKNLVKRAEDWAKEMEQRSLRVRTNILREDAPLFYQSLGFVEIKKQRVFDKSL